MVQQAVRLESACSGVCGPKLCISLLHHRLAVCSSSCLVAGWLAWLRCGQSLQVKLGMSVTAQEARQGLQSGSALSGARPAKALDLQPGWCIVLWCSCANPSFCFKPKSATQL